VYAEIGPSGHDDEAHDYEIPVANSGHDNEIPYSSRTRGDVPVLDSECYVANVTSADRYSVFRGSAQEDLSYSSPTGLSRGDSVVAFEEFEGFDLADTAI
jgi:hypothetical protein